MGMLDDLDRMGREYNRGDRNFGDLVAGSVNRGIAQPIGQAVSAVIPDFIEEPMARGAQFVADKTGLTDFIQRQDPVTQRRIEEYTGALGVIPQLRFAGATGSKLAQAAMPQSRQSDTTGMTRSSGDVFIEGFYGSPAEKARGLVAFGMDGMYQMAMNLVDPRRPALYRDLGLTPQIKKRAGQVKNARAQLEDFYSGNIEKYRKQLARENYNDIKKSRKNFKTSFEDFYRQKQGTPDLSEERVGQFVEKKYKNSLELFQSQLQANAHIRQQSNAPTANVRDIPSEAARMASARAGKAYFKASDFEGSWLDKAANFDIKDSTKKVMPALRAKQFESIITDTWENAAGINVAKANLFVKKPAGKYTGDHNRDISRNQKVIDNIKNVFKVGDEPQPFVSKKELYEELVRENDYNKANKNKSVFNIVGEDADGYFVQFSFKGSAKTEGGVNALTHVNKNGQLTTIVSDVHDMAVGGPLKPLGRYLEYSMQDELTVTPPMVHNVVQKNKNINTGGAVKKEEIEAFQGDVMSKRASLATTADEVNKRVGAGIAVAPPQDEETE